jgi:hypothetical protein
MAQTACPKGETMLPEKGEEASLNPVAEATIPIDARADRTRVYLTLGGNTVGQSLEPLLTR